ncbi:MurR/RpiR family transcriptional regulator [Brucella anthropi]|uniref:MurR/RpiR family transcriptional regulator n=1 Tax=Brucella anthropi TaxID=529 RepID=UPI00124CD0F9|nr:MurR/RpiR family transcriptional regulator [Brucella anthropi]KAB2785181.1 MurR/RpiR family transcriptional regulator [Brucella anthropi]QOD67120.1 MurR/RpiR family transcriptional regulator [Ochrobactrum sp. MT180101]
MSDSKVLIDLQARFSDLSPQLRKAAQFIIDNPEEIALHSMRGVAAQAQVHPNALLRLAREIGFENYETFRGHFQSWIVSRSSTGWEERALALREKPLPEQDVVSSFLEQETANLRKTLDPMVAEDLQNAVAMIDGARKAYILGLRSLFSPSYYFHYICRLFTNKTVLVTGLGGTNADVLRDITDQDVLIAFTHRPYAVETIKFIDFAREHGARTVIITDSKVSPAIGSEGVNIIVSNAANSLLPTVLPAMAIAQLLATMLLAKGNEETISEIRRSESQLNSFGIYVK